MKKYWKIMVVVVLVLGIGGIFGYQKIKSKSSESTKTQETATPQAEKFKVFVKEKGGLNLRKNAGTDGEILLTMPYAAEIEVEREQGDWYFGIYKEKTGYFKKEFVTREKPKEESLGQTYLNEVQGFSFSYPGDWEKTTDENKNDGQMYNDYTKVLVENKQAAGSPYFMLLTNPPAFGLENFSVEISKTEITIGGIKAQKAIAEEDSLVTQKPQRAFIVSFKREGTKDNFYLILGYFKGQDINYDDVFDGILSNFKFL